MAKCLEAALTGFLEVPKAGQGVETTRDFIKKIVDVVETLIIKM